MLNNIWYVYIYVKQIVIVTEQLLFRLPFDKTVSLLGEKACNGNDVGHP